MKAGNFCYVLNCHKMGKSSLIVNTRQRLEAEEIVCATVDITEIGTWQITPYQWYAEVIDCIVSSLNLDDFFDIDECWLITSKLLNVKRFSELISDFLLPIVEKNIVLFINKIDSTLSLPFNIDDFFAIIRDFYNKRAGRPDNKTLTFTMIGVATPSDLITDKRRTPFNIGRAIELTGFKISEVTPLWQGLVEKTQNQNIERLIQAVLSWSGRQPFFTQKLCNFFQKSDDSIPPQTEAEWV
ncbi:MAG: AAA-like domain-containing protein [Microcoleaceae cyanobacterium]